MSTEVTSTFVILKRRNSCPTPPLLWLRAVSVPSEMCLPSALWESNSGEARSTNFWIERSLPFTLPTPPPPPASRTVGRSAQSIRRRARLVRARDRAQSCGSRIPREPGQRVEDEVAAQGSGTSLCQSNFPPPRLSGGVDEFSHRAAQPGESGGRGTAPAPLARTATQLGGCADQSRQCGARAGTI